MNTKSVITLLLLLFVGGSVLYLVVKERTPTDERPDTAELTETESAIPSDEEPAQLQPTGNEHGNAVSTAEEESPAGRVLVYYFHRTRRCQKCLAIERYAHEAIREGFPAEVDSGRIEWRTVNLDETGNAHFVDDYDLTFSTVIVVEMKGDEEVRWRNLQDVWKLVQGEKGPFFAYVQEAVNGYLEG